MINIIITITTEADMLLNKPNLSDRNYQASSKKFWQMIYGFK